MQTTTNYTPLDYISEKKNKRIPYVGVTGFMTTWDVEETIDNYYKYRKDNPFELMMGFLLARKVVENGMHPKPERRSRYPNMDKFAKLLETAEYDDVFRVIHYNTKGDDLHGEISYLLDDLGWKSIVDGVQFNVKFPPSKESINAIHADFPSKRLIMQINSGAINAYKLIEIVSIMSKYPADYILIDPSGGTGTPINVMESAMTCWALKAKPSIKGMIGFAGGLDPDNVAKVVKEYKEHLGDQPFCIDAESGLMDLPGGLSMVKVSRYLREFFSVF